MKIKTKFAFKVRRLTRKSRDAGPGICHRLVGLIRQKQRVFQREVMERELFHSCMTLKNLAVVYQELPMSTDFLLEQLMESSQALRSVYADILTVYRNGRPEEAFAQLYQHVPVPAARKFTRILCRLDAMPPGELIEQMQAFEETFAAERTTRAMARAERKSLITTLTSTATIFVVLLNFVVVVVFLDTLQIISQLF